LNLTRILISNRPATFLVKVRGQSMIDVQLSDGDLAIVDRSIQPRDGDVVVVDVDGERSFKVWRREDDGSCLHFANAELPAFRTSPDATIEVWGVVTNSIFLGRRAGRWPVISGDISQPLGTGAAQLALQAKRR
jgi:DNA polymerase V